MFRKMKLVSFLCLLLVMVLTLSSVAVAAPSELQDKKGGYVVANEYGALWTFYSQLVPWYGGNGSFGNSWSEDQYGVYITLWGGTPNQKTGYFSRNSYNFNSMERLTFLANMGISFTFASCSYDVTTAQYVTNVIAITGISTIAGSGMNLVGSFVTGLAFSFVAAQSPGTYRLDIIQVPDPACPAVTGELVQTTYKWSQDYYGNWGYQPYSNVVR